MGLAASQARLLSITSRISDNELRAQMINNDKMRLATQSSQVSEAYVQALNDAQMMFSNYDANNMVSYQQLTFKALTAYNPYNNQYALTNASGNVLISEADAIKYKNANGDLNKFLESYGLKKTTSYFDNLATHYDSKQGGIPYKTGLVGEYGNEIFGYIYGDTDKTIASNLQEIYEGNEVLKECEYNVYELDNDGNYTYDEYGEKITNTISSEVPLHPGYMNAVASADYAEYTTLLADYVNKKTAYEASIAAVMSEKLEGITIKGSDGEDKKLSDLKANLDNSETVEEACQVLGDINKFVDSWKEFCSDSDSNSAYYENIKNTIDENRGESFKREAYVSLKESDNNNTYEFVEYDGDDVGHENPITRYTLSYNKDAHGKYIYELAYHDDDGKTWPISGDVQEDNTLTFNINIEGDELSGITISGINYNDPTSSDVKNIKLSESIKNTLENVQSVGNSVINSLRNSIYNLWDVDKFVPSEESVEYQKYEDYKEAAIQLYNFLFEGSDDENANQSTTRWDNMWTQLDDISAVWNAYAQYSWDAYKGDFEYDESNVIKDPDSWDFSQCRMSKIYDVAILDCIMNTYGEPNYTWIDKNNPNENGEAKAQWYTNLFELIQKNGHTVLLDGLASSTEWIKFAFESGIVNMKQVDNNLAWNDLIYSNCSDITEQTNDKAVAIAEAEYNAAMNKIENKDKRYDLELKNIDTEHNSLQVEYDSIKAAMDKNVERTFKIYS